MLLTLVKFVLLPLAMAATVGLSLAAYLALDRRRVRWLPALRIGLVVAIAILLFFPSWTRESREVHRATVAVMLDSSASMQIAEKPGGPTRYARALDRLGEIRRRLGGEFDIDLYTFDRTARRVTQPPVRPEGPETELAPALSAVLERQDREMARGLFVVSDGRATSGESPVPIARGSPIPIFACPVGSAEFPYTDAAIASVDAPDHLFKDSLGQVQVRVRTHGIETGVVTLSQGDRKLAQKPFHARDAAPVSFELKPAGSGFTVYSASIAATPGELTRANNTRRFPIFVETTPRKVLLLPATPSWEYTFVKRQLRSDPRYEVTDVAQFGVGTALELPAASLGGTGLIVIFGFRKQAFSPDALSALARHVESGDGVLVFAGNGRDSIEELLSGDLARLLPVAATPGIEEAAIRTPFVPSERSPLFRILEHPQANQAAWRSLPPILSAQPALAAMPAATILGTFSRYPRDTPALAYRLFGRGMTVFFATDETFLWKTLMEAASDPDRLHERFWGNLLSWLTDEARLTGVALTLSRLRVALGDEVYVRVEDYAGRLEKVSRELLNLGYRTEGESGRLAAEKVPGGFLASFVPPTEGLYTLSLSLGPGDEVTKEFVVESVQRDFTEPRADLEMLREIAEASGGRTFTEETGDLGSLKLDPTPKVTRRAESLFWIDRAWALALCLALLASEWLMRRKENLV